MQIYPAIDIRDGKCVRLRQGDYAQETIFGDDPTEMARRWQDEGAQWLHLVDLDGARAGKPVNVEVIQAIVSTVNIPCQLGGGLRNDESLDLVLNQLGVKRAIVGTAAIKDPEWFRTVTERHPQQIALGIDAKNSRVAIAGWEDVSDVLAFELARRYAELPLAAVIYTNIANDGMMQGVDAQTIEDLISMATLGVPVIASGGVTTIEDVIRLTAAANQHPNLAGAIIGRALYEGTLTVRESVAAAKPV